MGALSFTMWGGLVEILTASQTTRLICRNYSCEPINSQLYRKWVKNHFAKCLEFAAYKAGGKWTY